SIGNIPTFEPAVGTFIDGAYRSRSFLGTTLLFGLHHVELIRGPQTALYGKNVTAGLLSVYTRKPGPAFRADADLTWATIDSSNRTREVSGRIDVSGPLAPGFGAGLAVRAIGFGHTLTNVQPGGGPNGNNHQEWAARGQLSWDATSALS